MTRTPSSAAGRYLATLPYIVGYELTDRHVVLGFFGPNGQMIVHGAIDWQDGATTAEVATHYTRLLQGEGPLSRIIVVGYGPEGIDRAWDLADLLGPGLDVRTTVFHVQDGTWRILNTLSERWSTPAPIPAASPELAVNGVPRPATSRHDLAASVEPLPEPLFQAPDPHAVARLGALSPEVRTEIALTALDALAVARTDDLTHQRVLAHLVATDLTVRDAVLGHALKGAKPHHDRVDAIIRTFRAAPAEQRPALAATAAAAALLAAWHAPKVQTLLRHAGRTNRLAELVRYALLVGANPGPLRSAITHSMQEAHEAPEAPTANERPQSAPQQAPATTETPTPPARPEEPRPGPTPGL